MNHIENGLKEDFWSGNMICRRGVYRTVKECPANKRWRCYHTLLPSKHVSLALVFILQTERRHGSTRAPGNALGHYRLSYKLYKQAAVFNTKIIGKYHCFNFKCINKYILKMKLSRTHQREILFFGEKSTFIHFT
jgi:hypothetical protein